MTRRLWRPILAGAVVVLAAFTLAKARIFEPSTAPIGVAPGDPTAGAAIFVRTCAGCHGQHGQGGAGPALIGSRLTADQVAERVQQGGGIMPAGLVSGQAEADVVAYVVSIAGP